MASQNELLDEVYSRAFQYEARLGSCPQCVLAALKETLGIGDDAVFKASQGLSGGTALSSEGTCGALAGGMIAIGLLVGRTYQEFSDGEKKRRVFKYTKQLYDKFIEEYNSALCCGVQKKIFGRSKNMRRLRKQGLMSINVHVLLGMLRDGPQRSSFMSYKENIRKDKYINRKENR